MSEGLGLTKRPDHEEAFRLFADDFETMAKIEALRASVHPKNSQADWFCDSSRLMHDLGQQAGPQPMIPRCREQVQLHQPKILGLLFYGEEPGGTAVLNHYAAGLRHVARAVLLSLVFLIPLSPSRLNVWTHGVFRDRVREREIVFCGLAKGEACHVRPNAQVNRRRSPKGGGHQHWP